MSLTAVSFKLVLMMNYSRYPCLEKMLRIPLGLYCAVGQLCQGAYMAIGKRQIILWNSLEMLKNHRNSRAIAFYVSVNQASGFIPMFIARQRNKLNSIVKLNVGE
jgi:hypothetical protein